MADERDCSNCKYHVQGVVPPRCMACLGSSGYDPIAPPGHYLPKWEPKMETLEVSDVSLHAKVTDYVPPKLACVDCGARFGQSHWRTCPTVVRLTPVSSMSPIKSGQKHDDGKPPMDLLDRVALEETARVLAFGAKKYAAHNWRQGLPVSRTLAAALRHIFEFLDGETNDKETGLNHLGHAMCEVMFALNASKTRSDLDDRYKK